jgi:hypothetical protein
MGSPAQQDQVIGAMSSLLDGAPAVYVSKGAQITGGRGDAFVRVDVGEHERRQSCGLGAITQLWMLDVLMNLPLGEPVSISGLDSSEQWTLDRLPGGAVQREGRWVIRLCRPVTEIAAVVVRGQRLQPLLKQAAPFTRVAQRMVVLDSVPENFDEVAWEACYQGTGVWSATSAGVTEHVAAEPVQHRYYTAARWRVNERAYRAWLRNQPAPVPSSPADRVESRQPELGRSVRRSQTPADHGNCQQLRSAPR